jgi:hypothetical protein
MGLVRGFGVELEAAIPQPCRNSGENDIQHHALALSLTHKSESPTVRVQKSGFLSPYH